LFPELTDDDVVRSLKLLADKIAEAARRREQERRDQRLSEILATADHLKLRRQNLIDEAVLRARAAESLRRMEEMERQRKEEMTERQQQRELSHRMIDAGYKVLAKELHPDRGGSGEKMARLNRARAHQKQMS
jgi:hypothetical protein